MGNDRRRAFVKRCQFFMDLERLSRFSNVCTCTCMHVYVFYVSVRHRECNKIRSIMLMISLMLMIIDLPFDVYVCIFVMIITTEC